MNEQVYCCLELSLALIDQLSKSEQGDLDLCKPKLTEILTEKKNLIVLSQKAERKRKNIIFRLIAK